MDNASNIESEKKQLAQEIHNLNAQAGNYLSYLKTIYPYLIKQPWEEFIAPIYFSLLQSLYITMFKIIDKSGDDTKQHNIYRLLELLSNKSYYRLLSIHKDTINKICELRNKYYAHNTGVNYWILIKSNPITLENFDALQKTIALICQNAVADLSKDVPMSECQTTAPYIFDNTQTSDAGAFHKWLPKIAEIIDTEVQKNNTYVDFTQPPSQVFQQLYRKYGLSEDEIKFIEEKVKPME